MQQSGHGEEGVRGVLEVVVPGVARLVARHAPLVKADGESPPVQKLIETLTGSDRLKDADHFLQDRRGRFHVDDIGEFDGIDVHYQHVSGLRQSNRASNYRAGKIPEWCTHLLTPIEKYSNELLDRPRRCRAACT
jgi:hypothetical protein